MKYLSKIYRCFGVNNNVSERNHIDSLVNKVYIFSKSRVIYIHCVNKILELDGILYYPSISRYH